ncbi:MAG: EamA family transporter [Flavobacteriales bacterium]|nr:EamA family transporter [Flavobacteriales bacterium]
MNKKTLINILELNVGIFFVSTSGALGKYIETPPPVTIFIRALLALLIMYLYCKLKRTSFKIDFQKDWKQLFLSGALMGAHWITYFYSLQASNVAIGMLSLYTFPVITVFLEPFFTKKKIDFIHVLLGILVVIGIYFLAPNMSLGDGNTKGILWGIASAFCLATRNLLTSKLLTKYQSPFLMLIQMLVITFLLSPVLVSVPIQFNEIPWLPVLTLALITTSLGHTLVIKSFKNFSVSTASIIGSMQPIYGIIIALIFLKEYPTWGIILGGICILSTVLIESKRSIKKQ